MTLSPVHDRSALERSMPLDRLRSFRGERGRRFVEGIDGSLASLVQRRRAFRTADRQRWLATLEMLLANLALAAFNRIDPERFVAVSFNSNDYAGTPHSVVMLARIRDGLAALGLIEGQEGYRHSVAGRVRHARRTRLRSTRSLREMFAEHGLSRSEIGWSERRDIIIMREPVPDLPPEPADVAASRGVIERINAWLATTSLVLPEEAWSRVTRRYLAADDDADQRLVAGEEAMQLYRIFKGSWEMGGRLYGGWWINLPKVERQLLVLEGEAVAERDYARLHPTILFARKGIRLDQDIYSVPGYSGDEVRDLGKRTFNRLINRKSDTPLRLSASPQDRWQLPREKRFSDFVRDFAEYLVPVREWFGTGEGLRLQREDSDLALAVLDRLSSQDILALPVHDSFIVKRRHEAKLVAAMKDVFEERYGFLPDIR